MAKILLTDNSPAVLTAVGSALREAGHDVTCTSSGADALCLLANKPPHDLLLLDLGMPGVDGYEVLSKLGPTSPPVVIITGGAVSATVATTGKVARVLPKPFDLAQLMEAVNSVLTQPQAIGGGT